MSFEISSNRARLLEGSVGGVFKRCGQVMGAVSDAAWHGVEGHAPGLPCYASWWVFWHTSTTAQPQQRGQLGRWWTCVDFRRASTGGMVLATVGEALPGADFSAAPLQDCQWVSLPVLLLCL
jgi:hypothetical protein